MNAIRGNREMLTEGKRLEQGGQLSEAAAVYQKTVDRQPDNQGAVERLLVVYRKLKEYRKELAVIEAVLKGYEQLSKASQEKWIKEHPKAAGMGKAIFRQLGGASASGLGADPAVNRLLKRKMFVQKRIAAGKGKKGREGAAGTGRTSNSSVRARDRQKGLEVAGRKKKARVVKIAGRKQEERKRTEGGAEQRKKEERERQEARARKKAATEQRQKEGEERKNAAIEQRRKEAQEKKDALAAARKQAIERQRRETAVVKAEKLEAKRVVEAAKKHPSLFVISLRYLVPLEKIDAAMPRHMAFLDTHYKKGNFLFSGRQVPRTGGIIIARGKDRNAVERMMKQDPFVKQKLASVDIVEFSVSKGGEGVEGMGERGRILDGDADSIRRDTGGMAGDL
jgi:uncharacterized protein YciI